LDLKLQKLFLHSREATWVIRAQKKITKWCFFTFEHASTHRSWLESQVLQ